jgi:hypothetical protein
MSIVRLHVVAEGQTEEAFVKRILAPALWTRNVLPDVRCVSRLLEIRQHFPSPEHIDEGDQTAPSKRIQSVLPEYQKVAAGVVVAEAIGIEAMRRECKHFAAWMEKLESLPGRIAQ